MAIFFLLLLIHVKEKLKQKKNQYGSWKKEFEEAFYVKEEPFCQPAVGVFLTNF